MFPFFCGCHISNLCLHHRWSVTTRASSIQAQCWLRLPPPITIQYFQTSIIIALCCYWARRGRDGRQSYANTSRTCLQMSQRTLTLWNGGRYVVQYAHYHLFLTPYRIMDTNTPPSAILHINYLTSPASSVPCKQLFSCGGEITTKCCSQLGVLHFEELQVMKFAWRNNISDLAACVTVRLPCCLFQ